VDYMCGELSCVIRHLTEYEDIVSAGEGRAVDSDPGGSCYYSWQALPVNCGCSLLIGGRSDFPLCTGFTLLCLI